MTRRSTARFSTKLAACVASVAVGLLGCTTTSEPDADTDTGTEFTTGDDAEVETVADTSASATQLDLETVYFEFDSSSIRADARPALRKSGELLRSAGAAIRLEGYCDERGDEEYNLALGERRANSIRDYLVALGVDTNRMKITSFGKERPVDPRSTVEAWSQNRRGVLVVD